MPYSRLVRVAALLGISTITVACTQPSKRAVADSDEVTKQTLATAEKKWLDACYQLDRTTLSTLEADDFTEVTPSMLLSKRDQLDMVQKRTTLATPAAPSSGCSVGNQNIRIYGTVALVSDICTIDRSGGNPITAAGSYWQTQLWQQEKGAFGPRA
jgi:hypothetical protein